MHKTLMTLTVSTMALLALGCQPKTKTKIVEVPKKDKVYDFTKTSYGDPVNVPVHDAACNSQRGLSLTNSIIAEAYMGVETLLMRTIIEEDVFENAKAKDITRQTFEYQTINEGRRVYLCRDASIIPANTQAGAAISIKAGADPAQAGAKGDPTERLKTLSELHDSGVLSDEEFESKKAEILKEL